MRLYDTRTLLEPTAARLAFVGAVAIMIVATAICIDILMRWLFNSPLLGVEDLQEFNLAVIVSSFFPVCLAGGHNVTVRFLGRAIGPGRELWLEVIGNAFTLFIFSLFAWQFFRFTLYDVTLTGLATIVLEIPQAPWWWVVSIIMAICVPIQVVALVEAVLRALRGEPRPRLDGVVDTGG